MSNVLRWRPGLLIGILAAVGMLAAVACGAAEEATPTPTSRPPTATPTSRPPTATPTTAVPPTPTPTLPPGVTPVVATPTPTTAVPPTPTPTKGPQPKRGGTVRNTTKQDPPTFDSHTASSAEDAIHNGLMNTNLLVNGLGRVFEPDAAESYKISADGRVWTFKLRDNVRFHTGYKPAGPRDGTLMTAADVKYSLEKMMGLIDDVVSERSGWMKEFIDIKRPDHGLVVVDNRTIEIHLIQPAAVLAPILAMTFSSIYPEGTTREMLRSRPYGAGPFKLKEFQRGSLWKFERNPDYFKPGLPYLDEQQNVLISGDDIQESAFLTGRLDYMKAFPSPDNKPLFDRLLAQGKIRMPPYANNCRPSGIYLNMNKPPFDNKRLRQAVNLAFDRKGYSQVAHWGNSVPALVLDTGGSGHSLEEIMQMPGFRQPKDADVAEAKRIMQELYPNGLDLKMQFRSPGTRYATEAEFVAGDLRKISLRLTLEAMVTAQLYPLMLAANYQIVFYTSCVPTNTPEESIGSYFLSTGGRNWFGPYSNPKLDAGYLDMAATMDPTEHKRKAMALEDLIMEDVFFIPAADRKSSRAHWAYVQGITGETDYISFYMWDKFETVWRSDV